MAHVSQLKNLQRLKLEKVPVSDEEYRQLRDLKSLRHLEIRGPIGDEGFRHVATLNGLETLTLVGADVTGEGLSLLTGMRNLRIFRYSRLHRLRDVELEALMDKRRDVQFEQQ
ncbi:MAG: hypothetical protein WD648_09740 [Planctomycetaceae bacterium]